MITTLTIANPPRAPREADMTMIMKRRRRRKKTKR